MACLILSFFIFLFFIVVGICIYPFEDGYTIQLTDISGRCRYIGYSKNQNEITSLSKYLVNLKTNEPNGSITINNEVIFCSSFVSTRPVVVTKSLIGQVKYKV